MKTNVLIGLLVLVSLFAVGCVQNNQTQAQMNRAQLTPDNFDFAVRYVTKEQANLADVFCKGLSAQHATTFLLDLTMKQQIANYNGQNIFCSVSIDNAIPSSFSFFSLDLSKSLSVENIPINGDNGYTINVFEDHQIKLCCYLAYDWDSKSNPACKTTILNKCPAS